MPTPTTNNQNTGFRARVRRFLADASTASRVGVGKQARREARLRLPRLGAADASAAQGLSLNVDRASNVTEAWRLVFDHADFDIRTLYACTRVCSTFEALATRNRHWAPFAPLRDFRTTQEGPAPKVTCMWKVPSYFGLEEGVLHRRFVQRQLDLHARAFAREPRNYGEAYDRRRFQKMWNWPSEPAASEVKAHKKWMRKTSDQHMYIAQQLKSPDRFDTACLSLQIPGGKVDLGAMAADLQEEPNLFRLALKARFGYNGSRSINVAEDVELFFRLARFDPSAYTYMSIANRHRLDVAITAVRYGFRTSDLVGSFSDSRNYPRLLAQVPQDSPMRQKPADARLLERIKTYEDLYRLQHLPYSTHVTSPEYFDAVRADPDILHRRLLVRRYAGSYWRYIPEDVRALPLIASHNPHDSDEDDV